MTRESERKRLVELLKKTPLCNRDFELQYSDGTIEIFADHLLANGIVVPPVKVGEIVYWLTPYGIEELTVDLIKIIGNQDIRIRTRRFVKEAVYFSLKHFGKTVFTSREEAEKALELCATLDENNCKKCPCREVCNEVDGELTRMVLDLINRQKEEKEHLEYVLMAVMHSVDKWLEGDELKQDEANRACTMREKTLKITEKLHKKIDGLQKAQHESVVAIEKRKGEIERLNTSNNALRKSNEKMFVTIGKQDAEIERLKKSRDDLYEEMSERQKEEVKIARKMGKSEAYKEFAEGLKEKATNSFYEERKYVDTEDIDNLLEELTEGCK